VRKTLLTLMAVAALVPLGAVGAGALTRSGGSTGQAGARATHRVTIPDEDRFAPFAMTIYVGSTVRWTNGDSDDHTVVSDDAFNTAGHKGFDSLLGAGKSLSLTFTHPGVFVYYCRFHAVLDEYGQPKAPGPDGGIQDPDGNFGTPMSGVIVVLPQSG
jgi:plastocyanin